MPACPHCGAENNPDDRFCVKCEKEIVSDLPSLDLMDAGIVCPDCDTFNDPDQKTCIRCGQSLTGMTGFLHAVSAPAAKTAKEIKAVQAPPAAPSQPQPDKRPTAKMPAAVTRSDFAPADETAGAQPAPATGTCPFCQAKLTPGAQDGQGDPGRAGAVACERAGKVRFCPGR